MNSLLFLLSEGFQNVRRNGLMTLAALGTVSVALTVLGALLWTVFRLNEYALQQPQKFNQIDVFLPAEATRDKAMALQENLRKLPEVQFVRLVPREQAWAQMQSNEPTLTQALDENPLPDKLEVSIADVSKVGSVAAALRNQAQYPDIAKVLDASAAVRTTLGLARVIKIVGGAAAAGLFVATLFIVQNTIRLTVFARRREIRTMQLVGATPGFIRLPLLLEGLFHGVMGALIAGSVVVLCGREVSRFVVALKSPLMGDVPSALNPSQVVLGLVAIGAFVGLIGSHLSMRRFLKQI